MENENWIVLLRESGLHRARIVEGRLEADGIPVRLQYEPVAEYYAVTVDGLGEVQILVPEEWAEHARRVLQAHWDEEDLDWEDREDRQSAPPSEKK